MKLPHTNLVPCLLLTLLCTAQSAASAQLGTRFDFQYRVTDTRINVFDDAKSTRLQLPEGMQLPAIIGLTPAGEQLLTPRRDGVYLLIDGLWPQLALVWPNNHTVQIQYVGIMDAARQGRAAAHAATSASVKSAAVAAPQSAQLDRPVNADSLRQELAARSASTIEPLQVHQPRASMTEGASTAVASPVADVNSTQVKPAAAFAVRQRETIRETLNRWSKDAGWTHLPEHYTVDFDVQILGSVEPYTDFRAGVRALLATTSMTARPLQPCFYANQVLRVILRTQRCDQI